jgi:hypothetical protein
MGKHCDVLQKLEVYIHSEGTKHETKKVVGTHKRL